MRKNNLFNLRSPGKGSFPWGRSVLAKILLSGFSMLLFVHCSGNKERKITSSTEVKIPSSIRYAKGFHIEYHDGFKIINILNHFEDNTDTLKYLLLARGAKPPARYKDLPIINTPVRKLVGASSMHVALADLLGASDILVGLGDLKYVNSPVVRENIKEGKVKEVGLGGSMNNELIVSLDPDLVMVMGSPDSKLSTYQALRQMNIPVMVNAEWLEEHPLGRAEWIKLMGALINKEEIADKKFDEIEKEYLRLTNLTKSVPNKPRVIIGMNFKSVWHVPDGDSYMAQFMKDSGCDYKWYDIKGKGSLPLDFEAVYAEGLKADFWLNVGYVDSKTEILDKDKRYGDLKPFKNGNIFNNNGKVNEIGSNDYWESGAVNPHIVLADMIKILHPQLLPEHELVYYKKIL
jgi:iron complex transport system substrate-binding protein